MQCAMAPEPWKRRLYNLLEAEAESTVQYGRRGRLVAPIARVATGDARVFERMEVGTTLDTAVMVLLDRPAPWEEVSIQHRPSPSPFTSALDGLHGVESAAAAFPHYVTSRRMCWS